MDKQKKNLNRVIFIERLQLHCEDVVKATSNVKGSTFRSGFHNGEKSHARHILEMIKGFEVSPTDNKKKKEEQRTPKQIAKDAYDKYSQRFIEDPTIWNAAMKFNTWGDYMEKFEPNYKPIWLEAIRQAEARYDALVNDEKGDLYWHTCSGCKISFAAHIDNFTCSECIKKVVDDDVCIELKTVKTGKTLSELEVEVQK